MFDSFHWYLYPFLIIVLSCIVFTLYQKIRNKSRKVPMIILIIGIYYNSSSTVLIFIWEEKHNILKGRCDILQISILWSDSYNWFVHITSYWVFILLFLHHKNTEQHSRANFLYTRCEHWTAVHLEGQADCWEKDWFTFVI